jgi:hypothetical protein
MTATDWPTTLEPLGFTSAGLIAFRWHPPNGDTTDVIEMGEDELGTLMREFTQGALPMWPVTPCTDCGADAHIEIEGRPLCAGHAAGFGVRESEGGR